MTKIQILLLLFLLQIFQSCTPSRVTHDSVDTKNNHLLLDIQTDTSNDSLSEFVEKVEIDLLHTSIGDLVSGSDKSYFDSIILINQDFWTEFSGNINKDFTKIENRRLSRISHWVDTSFLEKKLDTNLVFYPFSGPDFLHVNYLYPNANEYLLLALEEVGSIPDWKELGVKKSERYLKNINNFLRDIYLRSYFITKHMKLDIKKEEKISGVLPSLYWFLSRTGHQIVDVEFVTINNDGELVTSSSNENSINGVKFKFIKEGTNEIKKLTYLSCDISDKGFIKKNPELYKYLNTLRECNTFVKSASYLMHYKSFKMIRDIVLDKSITLFQDDTGIPYKFMRNKKLKFQCFGKYVKPIKDFEHKNDILYQKDLELLYRRGSIKLPFSLGYHWRNGDEQNQMLILNDDKIKSLNHQIKKRYVEDSISQLKLDSISKAESIKDKFIVVGSFSKVNRAKILSKRLKKKGYLTEVFSDENRHLVVLGPYNSNNIKEELNVVKKDLEENAWIYLKN